MAKCNRCNRELKNPEAIRLGYGKVCYRKMLAQRENGTEQEYYCEWCNDEGCGMCDDDIYYGNEEAAWEEHHPNWGIPGGEW